MRREKQIALLEALLGLQAQRQAFLDPEPGSSPVSRYFDPDRFLRERERVLSRFPLIVAHASELAQPNSFVRRTVNERPLLLVRGDDGTARLFLNVCRHRGTRLVDADSGCRGRFSCPYHAWTWNSRGEFVAAPHFDDGFPGIDKASLGLTALHCIEQHGFIWWLPGPGVDLDAFLGEVGSDLEWIGMAGLRVHATEVQERRCNWKLLVEGGLEAYHFRVAHRDTIAPMFNDNLSSYEVLGTHFRSILPRASIATLREQPQSQWDIREHSNLLYTIFPGSSFLVQSDHVIWIAWEPVAADHTRVRMLTLIPKDGAREAEYWARNHAFTVKTLNEDFDLAESMQSGMASGANTVLRFGRYEGALDRFNRFVGACLEGGQ